MQCGRGAVLSLNDVIVARNEVVRFEAAMFCGALDVLPRSWPIDCMIGIPSWRDRIIYPHYGSTCSLQVADVKWFIMRDAERNT